MAWQQKSKRLRMIGLLLLFLGPAWSAVAAGQPVLPDFGRQYALVIGNQSYKNLDELPTVRTDAQDVGRLLEELYGFKVELLLDADRDRMLWTLSQLPKRLADRERDSLLIYYAGHSQLGRGGAGYWQPVDAVQNNEGSWISTDLISNILKTVRVRHILVATDAAYAVSLRLPSETRFQKLLETPSITVLASGGDKPAQEPEARNSSFARSLLLALRDNHELLAGSKLFELMRQQRPQSMPRYGYITQAEQAQGDFFFVPRQLQYREAAPAVSKEQPAPAPLPQQKKMPAAPPAAARQPQQGDMLVNEASGMEFVYVPGGCFKMGSSLGEKGRFLWEGPVHEVCVNGFWLGKYEVTQAQWQKIMGDNPSGFGKGGEYPVENVSWENAKEFLRRLTQRSSGRIYRLPSEAEWEYACRASGSGKYCGGDNPDLLAWHEENSGNQTHPAGRKQANAFGLHDMSGNVWEWCGDRFDQAYYSVGGVRNNPHGPAGGGERVVRGGSAGSRVYNCRAAFRYKNQPDYRENMIGFRVVMQE